MRQDGKTWRRAGLIVVATLVGVLLTGAIVMAQGGPVFRASKRGPRFADAGELITYTIDVRNAGDPAEGITLRDPLPYFVTFESCTYRYVGFDWPCTPPDLWTLNLGRDQSARTELVVRVNEVGTPKFPITNVATVTWAGVEWTMEPVTTLVNPAHVYLPIVARGFTVEG
jgi:uncharacterized repeat protein (TIGR01451 family)